MHVSTVAPSDYFAKALAAKKAKLAAAAGSAPISMGDNDAAGAAGAEGGSMDTEEATCRKRKAEKKSVGLESLINSILLLPNRHLLSPASHPCIRLRSTTPPLSLPVPLSLSRALSPSSRTHACAPVGEPRLPGCVSSSVLVHYC